MTVAFSPQKEQLCSATQAAILDAAEVLFAARSVDAVRVEEIIALADVTTGTFYLHFEDKEAVARAVAERIRTEVTEHCSVALAAVADPALRLATSVCIFMDHAWRAPRRTAILLRMAPGMAADSIKPKNDGLKLDIELGLQTGAFCHTSLELCMIRVLGAAHAGMAQVIDRPSKAHAAELARQFVETTLRGLGVAAPDARRMAEEAATRIFKTA